MSDRVAPHDHQVEAGLIGACMVRPALLDDAIVAVTADDFHHPAHARIWEALGALHLAGQPVDHPSLSIHLREIGAHRGDETEHMIAMLYADAGGGSSVRRYCSVIADYARRRRLLATALDMADKACDLIEADVFDWAQQAVYEIAQERRMTAEPVDMASAVARWMDDLEEASAGDRQPGVMTGLYQLDKMLSGLRPGQLVTVAGRPGMGKSIFVPPVAVSAARSGVPVMLVTIEMSINELVSRVVGTDSRLGLEKLRSVTLTERDWPHVSDAAGRLSGLPLHLLDDSGATITTVRTQARRIKAKHGLGLIVVDYLQLMTSTSKRDNRQVEVAEMSSGLKRIARDLQVPVIALAQLNRSVEYRAGNKPTLADLRESGAIENDSDVVMALYRRDYYEPESDDKGTAEILILKQRNGPVGSAKVGYRSEMGEFYNLTTREWQ